MRGHGDKESALGIAAYMMKTCNGVVKLQSILYSATLLSGASLAFQCEAMALERAIEPFKEYFTYLH